MKVSIITVTLNSEKYLSDCIESVRRQSHKDIEHIVIDGKSQDGTVQIIRNNSDHIAKWISETDRGMYDAINKGIQLATGDIIGILNSDDLLASPDVIRNGVTYKRGRFKYGWMPAHPTFYMRRRLIEQYGLYENHYYTSADYEFMARYLYKYKISAIYLEQRVVKMRTGGISNGNLKRRLRANRRDYLAMKKNHIPFSFFVSILKPISKLHQYKSLFSKQVADTEPNHIKTTVSYFPADGKPVANHAEFFK